MKKRKVKRCTCGKKITSKDLNQDICNACAQALAEDIDREMLGDNYDYFVNTGYFEKYGHFGDK